MFKNDVIEKLTTIGDDEPVFLLRASDVLAPAVICDWADRYFNAQRRLTGAVTEEALAKFKSAHAVQKAMREWKAAQPGQVTE
jgi:hypothetical protein